MHCISYISVAVAKHHNQSYAREKWFILAQGSRGLEYLMVGMAWHVGRRRKLAVSRLYKGSRQKALEMGKGNLEGCP